MDNCHNYVTISISLESIYNSFSFNSQFSDSKTGIFLGFRGKLLQRLLISCLFTTVFHLTLHFMTVETASFNSLTTKYQFLSIWYTFPLKKHCSWNQPVLGIKYRLYGKLLTKFTHKHYTISAEYISGNSSYQLYNLGCIYCSYQLYNLGCIYCSYQLYNLGCIYCSYQVRGEYCDSSIYPCTCVCIYIGFTHVPVSVST